MIQIISMCDPLNFTLWWLSYCFFYYCICREIAKPNHIAPAISCWISSLVYLIAKFTESHAFWFLIPCIIGIIIYAIVKKKEGFRYLASIIISNILLFLVGVLCILIAIIALGEEFENTYLKLDFYNDILFNFIVGIASLFTFGLVFSGLIKLIKARKTAYLKQRFKYSFFLLIPTSNFLFIIMFTYIIAHNTEILSSSYSVALVFVMAVALVLDFAVFLIVNKFEDVEIQNEEYQKQILSGELEYQKMMLLNEHSIEIGKIRHDINNILVLAKGFIEAENNEKAINILQNATNDLSIVKGIPICSNQALNIILKLKNENAKEHGIVLNIDVNENSCLNISDYDLCRAIGNLIDNSIEAVADLSDSDKKVFIEIDVDDVQMQITTKNKYNDDKIKAPRKLTRGHGKTILNEISAKYNGEYSYSVESDLYVTKTTMKNILLKEE